MTANTTSPWVRLGAAGLLFHVGILACHAEALQRPYWATIDRWDDERSGSTRMNGNSDKIESRDRTIIRVGDAEMSLTLDDVKAIQAALLDYLKKSDYEDRDALIGWTQGLAWIDPEGKVRIGPWLLGSDEKSLFLRYREPPGQYAGKAHRAFLTKKDEGWTVTKLVMERIRARR